MVKGVCKRLEFNYKLLTSSDTLAKKNAMEYIYILVTVAIIISTKIW